MTSVRLIPGTVLSKGTHVKTYFELTSGKENGIGTPFISIQITCLR